MKAGIYQIRNVLNDKIYIGSSKNIKLRKNMHLSELRRSVHGNPHLQRSFNKYGENSFIFETLFTCSEKDLIRLEQYHIDNYKPEYNICTVAGTTIGTKKSDAARKAQSDRMMGNTLYKQFYAHKRNAKKIVLKTIKPLVCQINIDTFEIIAKFSTVKEASEYFNTKSISSILQNKCFSTKGFTWEYENKYDLEKLKEKKNKFTRDLQPVMIFTTSGKFILETNSSIEAARFVNCNPSSITHCCAGKKTFSINNYIVMYKKDYSLDYLSKRVLDKKVGDLNQQLTWKTKKRYD